MTSTDPSPSTRRSSGSGRPPRSTSTDLALITSFAALIAVCAILPALPLGVVGVPLTLQMFGIFLAGAALGPRRGFLAVLLYLAVGTAGLPIFSGGAGGPAVWAGATVGYLVAFPLAALLVGAASRALARRAAGLHVVGIAVAAAVATVAVVTPIGALGLSLRLGLSASEAWAAATPFIAADLVKGVVAAIIAGAVHRAFPALLAR